MAIISTNGDEITKNKKQLRLIVALDHPVKDFREDTTHSYIVSQISVVIYSSFIHRPQDSHKVSGKYELTNSFSTVGNLLLSY